VPTPYAQVSEALEYVHANAHDHPSLDEIAASVNLSPHHFQRLFRRWVGVSPKRYLQALTLAAAKRSLRSGGSVLGTTYAVGLSGPSRLHDLFVSVESVTPGEYKALGETLRIRHGVHWTPFGPCSLALTDRGICSLRFLDEPDAAKARLLLEEEWPNASLMESAEETGVVAHRIFHPLDWAQDRPFHLLLRGTNYQVQVWRALLRIPPGSTRSYAEVAKDVAGSSDHARAVSRAIAANPIAFLIPCHRVVRTAGALGGYRWGTDRKVAILTAEAATA